MTYPVQLRSAAANLDSCGLPACPTNLCYFLPDRPRPYGNRVTVKFRSVTVSPLNAVLAWKFTVTPCV